MGKFLQHMEDYYLVPMNEGFNPIESIRNFANQDIFMGSPTHEMRKKGVFVYKVDNANIAKNRIHKNFEPTHTFVIHGSHYIVGKELGKEGTQIYRANGNKTHTHVDGFKMLHEHPELTETHIGRKIYAENKEAFKKMPITASKSQLQHIMDLDPSKRTGNVQNSTMQWIASRHYNSDKSVLDSAINAQHQIHPITVKRLMTMHGVNRDQATKIKNMPHLMANPHIAATVTNRLAQP